MMKMSSSARYRLNQHFVEIEGVLFSTFGITYCGQDVTDISLDREAVLSLIELCNKEELSAIHFGDVVNDFLIS